MAETIRLVVTVKAYPTPSITYREAVCVAGIRTDTERPEWVRLYPIEFRDLPYDQQFKKWSEIEVTVSESSDARPESRRPHSSTIRVIRQLSTARNWEARRPLVEPLIVGSMHEALANQKATGASLAAFRPHTVTNVLPSEEPDWTPQQLASLSQLSLFGPTKSLLEKIPWRWRYHYSCGGTCGGHEQTIIDWEIHQAWRRWRREHDEATTLSMIRDQWLNRLAGPDKDTVFLVGNQHLHPTSFLVLGVCYPKRTPPSEDLEDLNLWS